MSLRKFMHPRNKYKKVPDFKKLALLYPEFRNVVIIDLTGKVKVDFKNEESLRVLTQVLLKHDFNLDVKIPPNKLVPTLPLRLNYVLWIEDLMKHASFNEMENVVGFDIGTGAICIYPLLFARIYGNQMIATEIDETSVQTAIQHIESNNLQHLIKISKVAQETCILKGIIKDDNVYHFTMCNPPFFENEGSEKVVKQLPPRNAPTGNDTELTVQGGERAFITQMIEESLEIKEKVKVYTTMFGRRSNLLFLLKYLKKKNLENATWTEFCQGHTKRWGLAWTFFPKDIINLTNAPVIRKSGNYITKLLKQQRPVEIQFPLRPTFSSFDNFINFLEETLEELNVKSKELNLPMDDFNGWSYQLSAENDTWSHARRKRRLAQRLGNTSNNLNAESTAEANGLIHKTAEELNKNNSATIYEQQEVQTSKKTCVEKETFLVCNCFAEVIEQEKSEDDEVKISMVFEKGSGGKNGLETFRQYLINKLNIREYFHKQNTRSSKKKTKRLKKNETDINSKQIKDALNNDT